MCFLRKYEVPIIKIIKELIRFHTIYLIPTSLKIDRHLPGGAAWALGDSPERRRQDTVQAWSGHSRGWEGVLGFWRRLQEALGGPESACPSATPPGHHAGGLGRHHVLRDGCSFLLQLHLLHPSHHRE